MNDSSINLVINSDDLGMCHAVNVGIVEVFQQGMLSQASIMAPCPWFDEAAALAIEHDIPVGVHLTATCEWDRYRWAPITGGRTLVAKDGRMWQTIDDVQQHADRDELRAEFVAQVEAVIDRGLQPGYLDCHMGMVDANVVTDIARRFNLRVRCKPGLLPEDVAFPFETYTAISQTNFDRLGFLASHLPTLTPGWHLINCHVAADEPELDALCSPSHPSAVWTRPIRTADMACLLDARIRDLIQSRNIQPATMADQRNGS